MLPRPSMCTHHYIVIDNHRKGYILKTQMTEKYWKARVTKVESYNNMLLNTNDLIVGTIDALTAFPLTLDMIDQNTL